MYYVFIRDLNKHIYTIHNTHTYHIIVIKGIKVMYVILLKIVFRLDDKY